MLGIDDLLKRRPAQLSGGQRQRVAMGRALVREPKAFLMDEPLSNLDAKLRVQVRGDLKRLHQRLGITTIYVTHDQVEAMTLGERVAVLSDGVLQQLGAPQDVYDHPTNLFVAGFIGSPPMNLLRATARRRASRPRATWYCPSPACPTATSSWGCGRSTCGLRSTASRAWSSRWTSSNRSATA